MTTNDNRENIAPKKALNDQYARFCEEYIKLGVSGSQAAISAGYSPKASRRQAVRLLKRPEIKAEIERLKEEAKEQANIEKRHLIEVLKGILTANIVDVFKQDDQDFSIENLKELPGSLQKAIQSLKISKDGYVEIKLYNKMDAIKQICSMLGYDDATPLIAEAKKEIENKNVITSISTTLHVAKKEDKTRN